jgi:hypothetical protein
MKRATDAIQRSSGSPVKNRSNHRRPDTYGDKSVQLRPPAALESQKCVRSRAKNVTGTTAPAPGNSGIASVRESNAPLRRGFLRYFLCASSFSFSQ